MLAFRRGSSRRSQPPSRRIRRLGSGPSFQRARRLQQRIERREPGNVPSCSTGKVRGELKLARQLKLLAGQSILGTSNCLSQAHPTTEVTAFSDGYATLVPLPLDPAS